jgi:hypothetical protein
MKGFYILKSLTGIEEFGLRIDNPCKPVLNKFPLIIYFGSNSMENLKYISVENAEFWLPKCIGDYEMSLSGESDYISLNKGELKMQPFNIPIDVCSTFVITHKAPDNSVQSQSVTVRV